jgi:hypothetical protein
LSRATDWPLLPSKTPPLAAHHRAGGLAGIDTAISKALLLAAARHRAGGFADIAIRYVEAVALIGAVVTLRVRSSYAEGPATRGGHRALRVRSRYVEGVSTQPTVSVVEASPTSCIT